MPLKVLFIGDVVGSPGRASVSRLLPRLVRDWELDLVVCNAENAAAGSGLTVKCHEELAEAGVDVITLGDHAFRRDEVHELFGRNEKVCRPANYPPDAPGPDGLLVEARDGTMVGVVVVLGRVFMGPVDCPFRAADRVLERFAKSTRVVLVDAHAETTSEKQLLGRYLDGRVSAVLGTHTHVPTADECILPGGTAYITDVGMTGPYDSIIGRRVDRVLTATLTSLPQHFDVATGDPRLGGALVEIDPATGKAESIRRVMLDARPTRDHLERS
jgi:metallophosphoesterase (TIGR00282 family)